MKTLSITLAILGLVPGIVSAVYWFWSAKVKIVPPWDFEPVDPIQAQIGWMVGSLTAAKEAGRLNSIAAIATGISVVLEVLSTLTGSFPLN